MEIKIQMVLHGGAQANPSNNPNYVFDSLICLLDNGWQTQLREHAECKDGNTKTMFEVMNQILLIKLRIDYAPKRKMKEKYPPIFLEIIKNLFG